MELRVGEKELTDQLEFYRQSQDYESVESRLARDLRDARKELAELRAWREQVFLVVRQIQSNIDEHLRIVESLKK